MTGRPASWAVGSVVGAGAVSIVIVGSRSVRQLAATGPVETEDPSCWKGLREFPYLAGGPARIWHLADSTPVGCRGFNGPVPPPLLIRALQLCGDRTGRGRAVSTRPKVPSAGSSCRFLPMHHRVSRRHGPWPRLPHSTLNRRRIPARCPCGVAFGNESLTYALRGGNRETLRRRDGLAARFSRRSGVEARPERAQAAEPGGLAIVPLRWKHRRVAVDEGPFGRVRELAGEAVREHARNGGTDVEQPAGVWLLGQRLGRQPGRWPT